MEYVKKIAKEKSLLENPIFWMALIILIIIVAVFLVDLLIHLKVSSLRKRQQEYRSMTEQALKTIANTIDAKDTYTKGHSLRVAEYSKKLSGLLGMSLEEQENIYYMALMHDIGKIGIPDAILNKPEKLTEEEFEVMQSHTTIGADILKDFEALPRVGEGALYHHERFDGNGYPGQKQGKEIPVVAQIIGVADAYDAMATRRPYKEPMTKEDISIQFQNEKGKQFDAHLAELMIQLILEDKLQ